MSQSIFKVNVGKESYIWLFVVGILFGVIRFSSIRNGVYLSSVIALFVLALIWYFAFYYANYEISNDRLLVKSLEGRKKIDIESIRKIEKGNSIWTSGFFYFWYPYQKGLNIHYGHEEIFVNPKQREEFISKLLEINPSIEIN